MNKWQIFLVVCAAPALALNLPRNSTQRLASAEPSEANPSSSAMMHNHHVAFLTTIDSTQRLAAKLEPILQWSPHKVDLYAAIAVVILFGYLVKVATQFENQLESRQRVRVPMKASDKWHVMEPGATNFFAPDGEPAWVKTRASLRKLRIAAFFTGLLMASTVIVGRAIGSLSLCGDGVHLMGDTCFYVGLYLATVVSQWESDDNFTYGLGRVELLCAVAVVAVQYHEAANISSQAYERFFSPTPLKKDAGEYVVGLSCLCMLVNFGLARMMSNGSGKSGCGHDHGDSAVGLALLHVICDFGQNLVVTISGLVLWRWPNFYIIDPICILCFLTMLVLGTLPRLKEIALVLLEASPGDVDCAQLHKDLRDIKDVTHVRDFHAWCITAGKVVVTAHIYTDSDPMDVLQKADTIMKHKYGIHRFTFQVSDDDPP